MTKLGEIKEEIDVRVTKLENRLNEGL